MEAVKQYILDHWDGKQALWKSFWINGVLIPLPIFLLLARMIVSIGPDGIPTASAFGLAMYSLITGIIGVWVTLGLWRCTKRIRVESTEVFWANLVQYLIMASMAISVLNIVVSVNIVGAVFTGYIIYMLIQTGR